MKRQRGEEWWKHKDKLRKQWECTQQPGDFIFVPNTFSHLVVNLWPSAAINNEFRLSTDGKHGRVPNSQDKTNQKGQKMPDGYLSQMVTYQEFIRRERLTRVGFNFRSYNVPIPEKYDLMNTALENRRETQNTEWNDEI